MRDRPHVSLIKQPGLSYPAAPFHPGESFPELAAECPIGPPNDVYSATRECFKQLRLDHEHFGTTSWNPLGGYVAPGQRVFLLCNFVYHRRGRESAAEFSSKCTHASVIRAVADYVLIALAGRGEIVIGNAPLQSCDWDSVLAETGTAALLDFYKQRGLNVRCSDLRCFKSSYDTAGRQLAASVEKRDKAVLVNLGESSQLARADGNSEYAVSDYNPSETRSHHSRSSHQYAINREILESDVVIGIPKLKVHEKVALTCGLKNYVGISAFKQTLPHHQSGSPARGGDEHPQGAVLSSVASRFHAWCCGLKSDAPFRHALQISDRTLRRFCLRTGNIIAGAWSGNDTTWRMVSDLVYIARYADFCGTIHSTPQRQLLTFTDGIIAGEGDGPLAPKPVNLGLLAFSDDLGLLDWACCELIGFDVRKVPLVYQQLLSQSIVPGESVCAVVLNGKQMPVGELHRYCERPLRPPPGWRNFVENQSVRKSQAFAEMRP